MGFPPVRRRAGDKPDPPRPLRSEPVRRDEVRLVYKGRLDETHYCHHLTMPLGTYMVEARNGDEYYVGDPPLWRAVLDQLAAEFDAQYQAVLVRHADMLQNPLVMAAIRQMRPQRKYLPKPEIVVGIDAREFRCEHCGP
jgi:hypothetical protein